MSDTARKDSPPKVRLGRTDMHITRVGFGAWAIGGPDWVAGWGSQDDSESIAAIRHAVERGINWIDTAAVYGLGHSEELVRRALEPIPASERPYVFTKCGLVWDENNRRAPPAQVGRRDSIRRELNDSLRRLGVERIDLYQMHWPPKDGSTMADYWGALVDLRKEGKVRAIGLSNHNVHQLNEAEAIGHVDTLQPPFSAINRAAAAEELPWCHSNETGVIVYSPMQSGLLTGSFTAERARALGADDWRSRSAEFQGDKLQKNLALADSMRSIANERGTTVGAVAIAWTLAWRGVTGAIVGARSPAQVDGWFDAAHLTLSGHEIDQIAAAIHSTGAGTGPSRPPM